MEPKKRTDRHRKHRKTLGGNTFWKELKWIRFIEISIRFIHESEGIEISIRFNAPLKRCHDVNRGGSGLTLLAARRIDTTVRLLSTCLRQSYWPCGSLKSSIDIEKTSQVTPHLNAKEF
jgi:hypothetical protein